MKLAITVNTATVDTPLSSRFGRTPYFAICDPKEPEEVRFVSNGGAGEAHGSGVMAAQILIDNGVEAVVCARYGPNGAQALQQAGIACYLFDQEATVSEVIEAFNQNSLSKFSS